MPEISRFFGIIITMNYNDHAPPHFHVWSEAMLIDVIDVRVMDDYQLDLRFEDGVQGVVDVADLVLFTGVFAPLRSHDYFRRVRVDAELGTVTWPNGADLDPDVLYSLITGEPILLAEPEALLVA